MKLTSTLLGVLIGAFAVSHATANPVINVINVQTDDPTGYTEYLSKNPQIFESFGAVTGGTCVTLTGHRYPNQAFAWTIYNTPAEAYKSASAFAMAPKNPTMESMRSVVSAEMYAVLKPFTLPSGFERRFQLVVNDVPKYIEAATELEKGWQANGHNVEIGVFMPLGKGETSANLLDVRIFGVTPEAAGKLSLELMGQPSWNQAAAAKLASTVESVELDTFEMCKQVYPAS